MTTLVFVECRPSVGLAPESLAAIAAAGAFQQPIHAVIVGHHLAALSQQTANLAGVERVYCLDDAEYATPLAEPIAELLTELAGDYSHLVAAATRFGKNVMPRVAARLDVEPVAGVSHIVNHNTFERPVYAGRAVETVQSEQKKQVITLAISAATPPMQASQPAEIVALPSPQTAHRALSRLLSPSSPVNTAATASATPSLTAAKVVVAGGGAFQHPDEFERYLTPLASALQAGLGASRPAVAQGCCGSECLVGQTGHSIAPDLYIAVGISGAYQHLAGIQAAKTVIAINSDAQAPIFANADYGLVMDMTAALPAINQQLISKSLQDNPINNN